jgi:protein-arginine kinase activator protein McsA
MKHCYLCKKSEQRARLTYHNRAKEVMVCNGCNRKRHKKYINSEQGKVHVKAIVERYNSKHPDKVRSWQIAKKIPLAPCILCGHKRTDRHHEDSSKPLDVIMFCRLHHLQAHRVGLATTLANPIVRMA